MYAMNEKIYIMFENKNSYSGVLDGWLVGIREERGVRSETPTTPPPHLGNQSINNKLT